MRNCEPSEYKNCKNENDNLFGHCAEVFCTSSGSLIYCCTLCDDEEMPDEFSFKNHLLNKHQNYISIGKKTITTPPPPPPPIITTTINKEVGADNLDGDVSFSCDETSPKAKETLDEIEEGINHWPEYKTFLENTNTKQQGVKTEDSNDDEFESIVEYTITPALELMPTDENDVKPAVTSEEKNVGSEIIELNARPGKNTTNDSDKQLEEAKGKSFVQSSVTGKNRAGPRLKGDPAERRFKCEVCGFAFKEAYNLRQHMKRHETAQRFECSHAECDKRFHTRTELDTHERRHRGEFPFMCAQCGRRFITAGDLNQHNKRHLNLRPHKCDKCNKSFFDTGQLKHHYIVHTRERPHTCKTCFATFARRKSLVTHMKIHANKREYVCHICQAAFNQAPGLRMHLRNKHKDVISVQESLKQNEKKTIYSD